jgi:hypothetical protein
MPAPSPALLAQQVVSHSFYGKIHPHARTPHGKQQSLNSRPIDAGKEDKNW